MIEFITKNILGGLSKKKKTFQESGPRFFPKKKKGPKKGLFFPKSPNPVTVLWLILWGFFFFFSSPPGGAKKKKKTVTKWVVFPFFPQGAQLAKGFPCPFPLGSFFLFPFYKKLKNQFFGGGGPPPPNF